MTLENVLQKYSGADNEAVRQKKLFADIFFLRAGNIFFPISYAIYYSNIKVDMAVSQYSVSPRYAHWQYTSFN